jgi:DNA-directed RNA polymerase
LINILKSKIEKKKKEREFDDKTYWKRTMVKLNEDNKKIYVRLYHPKIRIDVRETKQALVPNSIHSYDASVIAFVVQLCKIFKIKIVIIHDSIGCNIIYAPIIKIIFKIANIMIIKNNINKPPFPFDNNKTKDNYKLNDEEKIKDLIVKILESSNIFR